MRYMFVDLLWFIDTKNASSQTRGTIKTQKTKDKTIKCNKETQMARQHEPL